MCQIFSFKIPLKEGKLFPAGNSVPIFDVFFEVFQKLYIFLSRFRHCYYNPHTAINGRSKFHWRGEGSHIIKVVQTNGMDFSFRQKFSFQNFLLKFLQKQENLSLQETQSLLLVSCSRSSSSLLFLFRCFD